jgi:thymidylate kinase
MVMPDRESLDLPVAPRFIYLAGCDGVGKTTQAGLLLARLRENGLRVRRLWLRFPFCFSLPLLAYARLRGFSRYEGSAGARHGCWDFERPRLLRALFPWALLVDAFLASLWHVTLPLGMGRTIVCERYVLDMLVDLGLAFKDPHFYQWKPGSLFLQLLPRRAAVVLLDLDAGTIRTRRPDLRSDRRLKDRLQAYRVLAAGLGLALVASDAPVEVVHRRIIEALRASAPPSERAGYAHLRSPFLHMVFRSPAVALASHWAFQGFFAMGWRERGLRLALEASLFLPAALLLGLALPWQAALPLAFLCAHTLNFLFNGHLWGALKHYGFVRRSPEEFAAYIDALQERAGREPSISAVRVSGSLARRAWTPASDFDARLLPAPGARNLLRACWFVLTERSRALFARFPLDLYLE